MKNNAGENNREPAGDESISQEKPYKKLTPKQERFVDEYLVDLNAARAYRAAGYQANTKVSSIGAWNMMRNPNIQRAIEIKKREREARTHVTQDKVVTELARIAFSDLTNIMSWNQWGVNLKDSATLPPDISAAISEVSVTFNEYGANVKVKLFDKHAALNLLAQHTGITSNGKGPRKGDDADNSVDPIERGQRICGYVASMRELMFNPMGAPTASRAEYKA